MNDLLNLNFELVPDDVKLAAESAGITVPEFFKRAEESYDRFVDDGIEGLLALDELSPMDKQASMEKLAEMDKVAFLPLLFAAASLPFTAMSAWDLAKNAWGGAKDIVHGNPWQAAKRLPTMGLDTLVAMPGVGVAGKIPKWLGVLSKSKGGWRAGLSLLNKQRALIQGSRKAAGQLEKIKALEKGESGWNLLDWFKSAEGKAAKAQKLRGVYDANKAALASGTKELSSMAERELGAGAGKISEVHGGFFPAVAGKDEKELIPVLDALHTPGAHKFYQTANKWDMRGGLLRLAPMGLMGAGALTNSRGLTSLGAKGSEALNYYGPTDEDIRRQRLHHLRRVARTGGYMAGYTGG